jgi:hypothetical protein
VITPIVIESRFADDRAPAQRMHVFLAQRKWFPHRSESMTDDAGRAHLDAAMDRYLLMTISDRVHTYIATVPNPNLEDSGVWYEVRGYVDPNDRALEYRLIAEPK